MEAASQSPALSMRFLREPAMRETLGQSYLGGFGHYWAQHSSLLVQAAQPELASVSVTRSPALARASMQDTYYHPNYPCGFTQKQPAKAPVTHSHSHSPTPHPTTSTTHPPPHVLSLSIDRDNYIDNSLKRES